MQEKGYRVFDLLKNEYFVKWVYSPTEESIHFWSKWIANHPERERDVEIARRIIQSSGLRPGKKLEEHEYDHMLERIMDFSLSKSAPSPRTGVPLWRPMSIAASLVIVLFAIYFVTIDQLQKQQESIRLVEKEASFGSKITTRLPDGTRVTLNSGSKISFPERFDEDARTVILSGEAFFEVEHNPEKPFFVRFKNESVQVLGTIFNIRSYQQEDVVNVSVASGSVSYQVPSGEEVVLKAAQMASYHEGERRLIRGPVDPLQSFGWKEQIIYFKAAPFGKIKTELERWYGVNIELSEGFKPKGTYSGQFKNESLEEVLKGLSFIYRFDFSIEETRVIISDLST